MVDRIEGYLEVGPDDQGQVVVVQRDVKLDADGTCHMVFSVGQARAFAQVLSRAADDADASHHQRLVIEGRRLMTETGLRRNEEPTSVGLDMPAQQERVRKLVRLYRDASLGGAGEIAATLMEGSLKRAEQAMAGGDVVEIVRAYEDLRTWEA